MKKIFLLNFLLAVSSLTVFAAGNPEKSPKLAVIDAPAAPSELFINTSLSSPTSLTLSWKDNSFNEEGFEIGYSYDGQNYTTLLVPEANRTAYYLGVFFPNSQVLLRVRAYNSENGILKYSGYSNVAGATTLGGTPKPVEGFQLIKNCSYEIELFFFHVDPKSVDEFRVEQSPDNIGFRTIATIPGSQLNNSFKLKVKIYPTDGSQFFRVRSINNGMESTSSLSPAVFLQPKPLALPAPPSNVRVVAKTDTSITYNFVNNNEFDLVCRTNIRTDNIVRVRVDGGPARSIFLGPDATSYTISGLKPKSKVEAGFLAVNGEFGLESTTIIVNETTFGPASAPTALMATPGVDVFRNPNVVLTWKDNSDDEDGFVVEAAMDSTKLAPYVTLLPNKTTFTHVPISEGVTWYYRIYANNKFGKSKPTAIVSGRVAYSAKPEAPYNLRATLSAKNKPTLTWQDDSNREEKFEIERTEGTSTTFTAVGTANRNAVTFTDTTALAGKTYKYRVRATNTMGASSYTATVTSVVPAAGMGVGFTTEDMITVFPNPTVNSVRVSVPESISQEGGFVSVYDDSQRLLFRRAFTGTSAEQNFDMSGQRTGMYMVVVTTETQKISKKLYKN